MPPHRRQDDPDSADYKNQHDSSEVTAMWNGKGISVKGSLAVFFLAILAIIGSNLYAGFRVESAIKDMSGEHRTIRVSQDRTSCIVAMTTIDRDKFRSEYRPGAFKQWCPWVDE